MKKPLIIALIVILVLAIIIGGVFIFLNKEKTPITSNDFVSIMEKKDFDVIDSSSQFSEYDYVENSYIAISSDYSYQIEFYELSDESYATQFYNNNQSIFKSSKGNASGETSVAFKNYAKYTLSSNNKYSVVSKIGNTVIYLNVDSNYKDTVNNILNELGY